jgi:hypothetical protein
MSQQRCPSHGYEAQRSALQPRPRKLYFSLGFPRVLEPKKPMKMNEGIEVF